MSAGMAVPRHQLTAQLTHLRLAGMLETLDARQRQAIEGQWSYEDFLARLLDDESERRAQKQLAQRLRQASVHLAKTFETFDFAATPSLNRQQALALASGAYIRAKHNILICGPTGTGKSHVAQGLAHDACRQGFSVLFVNTHVMLRHLHGGRADGTYAKRLAAYLRPAVLILDDFGLKPLEGPGPADLYDIINGRYEVGSIVLTSNRAPEEWPALFGDPLLASAGLDRLGHHAETLVMTGASYRARRTTPLQDPRGGETGARA